MEFYQVKSGDSLSIIARDVLGDIARWPDIARLNNLVEPYTIFPGMQLILPADIPGPVVVPRGDVGPFPGWPTPTTRTTTPAPAAAAGFDLRNIEPTTWLYLGLGAVALFLMMDTKK